MRVLITGGLGVNGSWVARLLLGRGDYVTVLETRPDLSLVSDIAEEIDVVVGDVTDVASVKEALEGRDIDVIVHMAAIMGADENPTLAVSTNVAGVAAVCEAAVDRGVRRIVYTSSRAVYGNIEGEHAHPLYKPIDEDHRVSGVALYDVTKIAGEQVGQWFARNRDIEFVSLRFATIYGPGKLTRHGGYSAYSLLIENPARGETARLPQGAEQRDDVIYAADVAGAVLAAIDVDRIPRLAYNIGTGTTVSLTEFADVVRKVIPNAEVVIGPGLDPMQVGVSYYGALDSTHAAEDLHWTPSYNLEEGIRHYVSQLSFLSSR